MKQGNLLLGIYLSDSKYKSTNMTNAPVCLSVIQSKSSDVNPIWPSLFEHIQEPADKYLGVGWGEGSNYFWQ